MPLDLTPKPFVTDIPEGKHAAVCVVIADLGTVYNPKFDRKAEKIQFEFELVNVHNHEGWPKTIPVDYTASLDNRAILRKHLTSWRGKGFTPEELQKFSLKPFLGRACKLLIIHNNGKGEKANNVYANVEQIDEWPPEVPAPQPRRSPLYFDFAEGKADIPYGMPEYIADKIKSAPEWRALIEGRPIGNQAPALQAAKPQAPAEIVGLINQIGLAWPYDKEELDSKFDPAVLTEAQYDVLERYAPAF